MRRALATVLTLGLLSSFLLVVVLGLMLAFGVIDLAVAALLVVLLNLLLLLVGPTINDFVYAWLYDLEWLSPAEFEARSPASAEVIQDVTTEYGYDEPKIGYIEDLNPNAFTYGSARFNARIVVTEGCFEYLNDEELASVVAHELGHVTSRDFVIMTLANTIVQLLYLVAVNAFRLSGATRGGGGSSGSGGRSNATAIVVAVGALSYVLWFFSQYLVLYLSRVREYAADAFAAEYTHPDALSTALVKIAYGLVDSEDDAELARVTRTIGIMDATESHEDGLVYEAVRGGRAEADLLERSFLYDLENPWARLLELGATHPLTGKRVRALSELPGAERFDLAAVRERHPVDRGRLRRQFGTDLAVLGLPTLVAIGVPFAVVGLLLLGRPLPDLLPLAGVWLGTLGVAGLVRTLYRYPRGEATETSVLELLADPYASPVRGHRVELSGTLIGRGQAGYRFSEDLMLRDPSGLMFLQYEHWLPLVGNVLFAVRRVPDLVGEAVDVEGWFLRGMGTTVGVRRIRAGDESIAGYVHLAGLVGGGLLLVAGAAVLGVWWLFDPLSGLA